MFIVIKRRGTAVTAASNPRVHATRELADAEAQRMVASDPSSQFFVMQSVGSFVATTTVAAAGPELLAQQVLPE